MPWVYKTVTRYSPSGIPYTVKIKVWVPGPKKPKNRPNPKRPSSRAAAQRAARYAAQRRAARLSAIRRANARRRAREIQLRVQRQRALADARRKAYEELIRRQREVTRRAGVIKDSIKAKQPPPGPSTERDEIMREKKMVRDARMRASAKSRADAIAKANASRDATYRAEAERRLREVQRHEVVAAAKAGDSRSARVLEAQLERERLLVSKGGAANSKYLAELQKKYEEHEAVVWNKYLAVVARIRALAGKGNVEAARALYESPDFRRLQAEYKRLHGASGDVVNEGSYAKFYKGYKEIGDRQREWYKRQMDAFFKDQKEKVQNEIRAIRREQRGGEDMSSELRIAQAKLDALNGKTTYDRKEGRYRTIEEELEHQQAQMILEQTKIHAQKAAQEQGRKAFLLRHGMQEYKGQIVRREQVSIIKASERLIEEQFGGKAPSFKRREDLMAFADKLVDKWEASHPRPPLARGSGYARWVAERSEYEDSVYALFKTTTPEWWDRLISAPVVSHALSAIQTPLSSIGALARVGSAAIGGSSTVGGVAPTWKDVPPEIMKAAQAHADKFGTRGYRTKNAEEMVAYINRWMASPAGQKWIAEETKRRLQESKQEDTDFVKNFYGAKDIGDWADALNAYGSRPGQDEGANLLFQLLADPANAIPLKFTTYLARGKYAAEVAQAAKGLTPPTAKAAAFAKSFLAVDEGTLTMRRSLSSFKKELEQSGLTPERFVDLIRERTAGITDKGALAKEIQKAIRASGLDPAKVDEATLFNFAEYLATKEVDDTGLPLLSQQKETNAYLKRILAEAEEAKKKADETLKLEASKVKSAHTRRMEGGGAARERLAIKREAQEAALEERAKVTPARAAPDAAPTPMERTATPGPEPSRNPFESGATDGRVAQRESRRLARRVRSRTPHPRYEAADEFYSVDELGNRLPRDFAPDEDYRRLVKLAKDGNADAREQLVNRSRIERNLWRMRQEDRLLHPGEKKSKLDYQPTTFDLMERSGTVSDDVAKNRLVRNQHIIRWLKARAASANANRARLRAHFAKTRVDDEGNISPLPRLIERDFDREELNDFTGEFQSLDADVGAQHVLVGQDILDAAASSPAGVRGVYSTFSHDNLRFYKDDPYLGALQNPRFVRGMEVGHFSQFVERFSEGASYASLSKVKGKGISGDSPVPFGSADYRDGGQFFFEVFHQLRLAKDWDKLREFTDYMTALANDGDNIFAWQWMAMAEHAGLPYAMHWDDIVRGFYAAAETQNLIPELALAQIPFGYYAKQPPVSFGLSSVLRALAEDYSPRFHAATKGYSIPQATAEVTKLFRKNSGESTRVLHYSAERFGDQFKYSPIRARALDEMTHSVGLQIGKEALADIAMRHHKRIPRRLLEASDRQGRPMVELIDEHIRKMLDTFGGTVGPGVRPSYPDFRHAIEEAYYAGELPAEAISPKGHQMMFLMRLQMNPDAGAGALHTYADYMLKIGGDALEEAKALTHDIFGDRIRLSLSRQVREGPSVPVGPRSYDAAFVKLGFSRRMFELLEFAKRRATANQDALARDLELEATRMGWLNEGSVAPSSEYVGTIDTADFTANVKSLVADIRRHGDRAVLRNKLEGTIRAQMQRLLHNPSGELDQINVDAIQEALRELSKYPEAARQIRKIQEELGIARAREVVAHGERGADGRLIDEATRAKKTETFVPPPVTEARVAREVPPNNALADDDELARISALRAKEAELYAAQRKITNKNGSIRKGKEERFQQLNLEIEAVRREIGGPSRRVNLDEMRAQMEAESAPAEIAQAAPLPGTPPAATAARSTVESLYERIFNMSESEWLRFEKARARRVLKDPRSSVERKAYARAHLRLIADAEYVIKNEKARGAYIPWRERATFQRKVLTQFGAEAEKYMAPKEIAPRVLSPEDAIVEEGRTYWRLLQTASPVDVPSTVKSISYKGEKLDHIPKSVWNEVEREVSDAIADVRGWRADTRTRTRHRGTLEESQKPLGRLRDNDPAIIKAKQRALEAFYKRTGYRISVDAYDEARKVLWKGYVQNKNARWLLARARAISKRTGADLEEVYLKLREKEARIEARRQLGGLAWREMFGHGPESIFGEFARRHSDDTVLKNFVPELSPFQRRTLQEHVKALAGLDELDDRIVDFLQSANMPPFEKGREAVRDFLKKSGAWSPRVHDDFILGAKSWSIHDEAKYWRDNYGYVPPWTDPERLATEFREIFHNAEAYFEQMKGWGIFNRSQELKLRSDGKTAREIEELQMHGDEALGIPARRERELQRRYVIERYGRLVSRDGQSLDAMPWLMTPEEYKRYLATQGTDLLPEGFLTTKAEVDEVVDLIEQAMAPVFQKIIGVKAKAGAEITYHDIYRVASEVQATLLANPKWAKRRRDVLGKALNAWSWFSRSLIFSNPAFLVTNFIDAFLKGGYYRFKMRGAFASSALAEKYADEVAGLNPTVFGWDHTSAMYRVKQASALERLQTPRGYTSMERTVDRALALADGVFHQALPAAAGRVELFVKMNLARSMYPQVYEHALHELGDPALADAFAKNFIGKEVLAMWPTAGDGPIEQLFNRFVPFSTYSIRNKVLFIGEAVAHPAVLNYIHHVGYYIEQENLRQWEIDHPGQEMPEHLRRMIRLPWAPDYYLDLSTFSDAARGLRPIYDIQKEQSILDFTASWIRLINPGAQAIIYSMFNAMNVPAREMWRAELDENGFPTGNYTLVQTKWLEPWSDNAAEFGSGFWWAEAMKKANELGVKWTDGELTQMVGQIFLFNGIRTFDKGAVLSSFYFTLRAKDSKAAALWLNSTVEGQYVKDYLMEQASDPREVWDRLKDIERFGKDPSPWLHDQTPEFEAKVRQGRAEIAGIREAFAAEMFSLERGTPEYREAQARMYAAINRVYLNNPELMKANVYGKSAAEWSAQLERWQVDHLTDAFFAMNANRPKRANFKTAAAYSKAVAEWEHSKQYFLEQYPQVKEHIARTRDEFSRVRDQMQKDWDATLNRIARRKDAIDVAKRIIAESGRDSASGARAQERLDRLYLQNELDFSLLEREYAAVYFSDSDFEQLPRGIAGPPTLKGDFVKRVSLFTDFDRRRYDKAVREGKGSEFLADMRYNNALRDAILKAKGGSPFGEFDPLKFVKSVKSDSYLRREYFARNPGKQQVWERTDAYIKHISVWGKLMQAGRFDEANRVWDGLPQWVKDRYYAKHPERRRRAQQTAQYLGYMQRWVNLFESGKNKEAMRYFHSLPTWAKERYYAKHPEKRAKFEQNAKVGALLDRYFRADKDEQTELLKRHPELVKFLAKDGDVKRFAILEAYRRIPKDEPWLRRIFKEQHPDVFSDEAIGERKLRRVYDNLAQHPEVLPEFEKWVNSIWDTYAEMLKHAIRPLNSFFHTERKVPARKYRGSLSAEESSRLI